MEFKKSLFSEISNAIFLIFTLFMLCFLWCNFYFRDFYQSIIATIILISIFSLIYVPKKISRYSKNKTLSIKNNKTAYYKMQLLLSKDEKIMNFIIKLYNLENIEKNTSNHIFSFDKDFYICFTDEEISNSQFYNFLKNAKSNKIEIFCITKPKSYLKINNKEITFIDFNEFLNKCKEKEQYFDNNIVIEKKTKISFKGFLCVVFCKGRSKSYLYLGLLILFSCLFTPYNIYYIICSSILFLLSIFSKFNTIFN